MSKGILMTIVGLLFSGIYLAALLFLNGITLSLMWRWFMTPWIHVEQPTLVIAMGVWLIASLCTKSVHVPEINKDTNLGPVFSGLMRQLAKPILVLVLGYIVHSMM